MKPAVPRTHTHGGGLDTLLRWPAILLLLALAALLAMAVLFAKAVAGIQ